MRLVGATVYALRIPFVEEFAHSAHRRQASDSVVVRVEDEDGVEGFGEGAARPYVTGETPAAMVDHLARDLWPALAGVELPDPIRDGLASVDALIPEIPLPGVVAASASRCALELATLDCLLRGRRAPMARLLRPVRERVTYGGVITAGSVDSAVRRARQMTLIGLRDMKVKVGAGDEVARVRAIRAAVGPEASLRLDANGAWDLREALTTLTAVAPFDVAAVEQPLPRAAWSDLRALRRASPVKVMVDESLVTVEDAERLLADEGADLFNIRVSKCGGIARSVRIAGLAAGAGVGVQVGSQVGETAVLAAAGRHLAAWLAEVAFVEGSYGTLLLTEDVSRSSVRFGHGGRAKVLTGAGLGVDVVEERLRRYAGQVVELEPARVAR